MQNLLSVKIKTGIPVICLLLFWGTAKAQTKKESAGGESGNFSVQAGLAGGIFINSYPCMGLKGAVVWQHKNHFFELKAISLSNAGKFNGNKPNYFISEAGLLYGIIKRKSQWVFSGAAGISFTRLLTVYDYTNGYGWNFNFLNTSPGNSRKDSLISKNTIGVPVSVGVFYQPSQFGIGITADGGINSLRPFLTAGVTVRYLFKKEK
jgi:hypothetical protein